MKLLEKILEKDSISEMPYPKLISKIGVPSKSELGMIRVVKIYENGDSECGDTITPSEKHTGQGCMAGETGKFCRHQQVVAAKLAKVLIEMLKRFPESDINKKPKERIYLMLKEKGLLKKAIEEYEKL